MGKTDTNSSPVNGSFNMTESIEQINPFVLIKANTKTEPRDTYAPRKAICFCQVNTTDMPALYE